MRDGDLQEVVAGAEGELIVDLLRKWTSPCRGTTPPAAASQRVPHRHLSLRSPPPPPDPFSPFLSSKCVILKKMRLHADRSRTLNSVVQETHDVGLVGADRTINSGSFAVLACLPTIAVMVPSDEAELLAKVGAGPRTAVHAEGETDLKALLEYGTAVQNCLAAALVLKEHYLKGLEITAVKERFCKVLDQSLV
ncbi:hypothetical protein BHE74_00020521 [Ensete ventricosum]|nr:hypothetical protein GW17_00050838 [Ensete ventricosum]RWW71717.1 hypothetical protein BHE74_00020521 [Ensete ventricosum]